MSDTITYSLLIMNFTLPIDYEFYFTNSFLYIVCNCNNHSDECVFNETAYAQTGRGGVCLNCDGNTYGIQCETCAPFYYPRPDRNQTDSDICEGEQVFLRGNKCRRQNKYKE